MYHHLQEASVDAPVRMRVPPLCPQLAAWFFDEVWLLLLRFFQPLPSPAAALRTFSDAPALPVAATSSSAAAAPAASCAS